MILIVDDERSIAVALSRQLKQLGLQTVVLEDPTEVEATIAAHAVTAIICDKRMPFRSGVEVLASVKALFPQVSRCLLTGSMSELTQAEVDQLSPCMLINKPWSEDDLTRLMRGWGLERGAS